MQHHRPVAFALMAAFLIAACRGGGSPASTAPSASGPTAANGVEGRTFLSTAVDGRVLVAGTRIRLSFLNGQAGASAGCNSMGGAYRIDGGRLVTTQLITTDMGCAQALMTQDAWVADLLDGATLTLDGNTLILAKNGVRLTLLDRTVADPDRPLLGTRWLVDGLLVGDVASSIPNGIVASLMFADGRVDVAAGCNTGSATATISGDSITFGNLGLTRNPCPSGSTSIEPAIVQVLNGTVTFAIDADALTLRSGGAGLTMRAAP